jgi:hypothetical protein
VTALVSSPQAVVAVAVELAGNMSERVGSGAFDHTDYGCCRLSAGGYCYNFGCYFAERLGWNRRGGL